jgi:hypothetical protein
LAISRRNKCFVPDSRATPTPEPMNLTKRVEQSIMNAADGRTGTELEAEFNTYHPRSVRYSTKDLTNAGIITNNIRCRCHNTTIFYKA